MMFIKTIKSDQFGGIRKLEKNFEPGLNVVCGDNEAGKSTLVNILSETLFCTKNYRKNSEEQAAFFPSKRKNGVEGDNIGGTIVLATDNGEVSVSKSWEKGKSIAAEFIGEDKTSNKDIDIVDEKCRQILQYGSGVYNEILFSSQKNVTNSLKTILESAGNSESAKEIFKRASMELGGIRVDKIEEKITEEYNKIVGDNKFWNADFSEPTINPKGKDGRWTNGTKKTAVEAYYNMKDAQLIIDELKKREDKLSEVWDTYARVKKIYDNAEKDYKEFAEMKSKIDNRNSTIREIDVLNEKCKAYKDAIKEYRSAVSDEKKAKILQNDLRAARLAQLGEAFRKTQTAFPADEEIHDALFLETEIGKLKNRLTGINIDASVNMLNGNTVEIRSVLTGEKLEPDNGKINIAEAVSIVIPDVAEILLSPVNTDVAALKNEIENLANRLNEILKKYDVKSPAELEKLYADHNKAYTYFYNLETGFKSEFVGYDRSELQNDASERVRSIEEINNDISSLCGNVRIDIFIDRRSKFISDFEAKYVNSDNAGKTLAEIEKNLIDLNDKLIGIEEIPEKFRTDDTDTKLKELDEIVNKSRDDLYTAQKNMAEAETRFKEFEKEHQNAKEKLEDCERNWIEKHDELLRRVKIRNVFYKCKTASSDTPAVKFVQSFKEKLDAIAGEHITAELPDPERMDIKIFSNDNFMDYNKLSEGTKDALSLAFRLAVLDRLFPNGGGVMVLDDPLTNMDPNRVKRSCKLIYECSRRNQIIFLTCREEYAEKLHADKIIPI